MPAPSAPPAYGDIDTASTTEPPAQNPVNPEAENHDSNEIFENETSAPHLPGFPKKNPNPQPPPYQPAINQLDETNAASSRTNVNEPVWHTVTMPIEHEWIDSRRSGCRHDRHREAGTAAIVAGSIVNDLFSSNHNRHNHHHHHHHHLSSHHHHDHHSSSNSDDSAAVGIAAIACIVCNVFGCLITGVYLLAKSCKHPGHFRIGYFLAGIMCLIVLPAVTITSVIIFLQHNPNLFSQNDK
ncbi:unnamed protein product, partial [Mesorhabditis spiculigera]